MVFRQCYISLWCEQVQMISDIYFSYPGGVQNNVLVVWNRYHERPAIMPLGSTPSLCTIVPRCCLNLSPRRPGPLPALAHSPPRAPVASDVVVWANNCHHNRAAAEHKRWGVGHPPPVLNLHLLRRKLYFGRHCQSFPLQRSQPSLSTPRSCLRSPKATSY